MQNHCRPDISVIIPVYNVATYLQRCLTSVINQTFGNIEIIVVNDGSTDDSLNVIRGFIEQDSRIILIDKQNEGVSLARKAGVEKASADYIHFLDGDDYIAYDLYEQLYRKATETKADMVLFNFCFDAENGGEPVLSRPFKQTRYTNIEYLKAMYHDAGYYAVWHYLHKRTLYNHEIEFEHTLSLGEDAYLTTQLCYYSSNIEVLPSDKPLLHYITRSESVMNHGFTAKKAADYLTYPEKIATFLSTKPEFALLKEDMGYLTLRSFVVLYQEGWLEDAAVIGKRAKAIFKEFPALKRSAYVKSFTKLFLLYAIHPMLASPYVTYYRKKKKIR